MKPNWELKKEQSHELLFLAMVMMDFPHFPYGFRQSWVLQEFAWVPPNSLATSAWSPPARWPRRHRARERKNWVNGWEARVHCDPPTILLKIDGGHHLDNWQKYLPLSFLLLSLLSPLFLFLWKEFIVNYIIGLVF